MVKDGGKVVFVVVVDDFPDSVLYEGVEGRVSSVFGGGLSV